MRGFVHIKRLFGSLLLFLAVLVVIEAQEGNSGGLVPADLRRPQYGEAPRYPRDVVIGDLGRGTAPEAAYAFARGVLQALLRDTWDSSFIRGLAQSRRGAFNTVLEAAAPDRYRIGGGREEPDGSISFLFRFLGSSLGASGELYLVLDEGGWRLDDIIIEEPRDVRGAGDAYPYDFAPYERFF
ncbi:MAG: hypothetical protein LBT11_03920 [Treponema sp.]|jgi:hypothetical protein|nr:hypothetical protein [Treponema sp.]